MEEEKDSTIKSAVTTGIMTKSFLEPGIIIGLIVYALIAWGVLKSIEILKTSHNNKSHKTL